MMRRTLERVVYALLLPLAAGCGHDSTKPSIPSLQDGLWTASGSPVGAILRLEPTQLRGSGMRDPATTVTTPSARLFTLSGVAFDGNGTMWIASQDDSLLLAFEPGALTASGARDPRTVILPTARSLAGPTGLAFDPQHRLWVVNRETATLVRFDPGQLAAGGARVPAVTLSLPGSPTTLAFDAAGALWVSDAQFHAIHRLNAAQLETSGSPALATVLTAANSLVNPTGLAFDAAGNLWVANTGSGNLVAFTPAQLAGTGPLAPHIVISPTRGSLSIPVGLAFEGDGSLWVVGGGGALTKFARSSLGETGAPAPSAQLQVTGRSLFWSVALWPKPAGLPLN